MRGKRCAGLKLMLLPAALCLGAAAAAEDAPPSPPQPALPATIVVLDGSSSMNAKLGGASKIASVKTELGAALGTYAGRLSFGLVAFGHRKSSNCADSETLAKPGELTFAAKDKLFDKIKPKGSAPIAAALSDAAKSAQAQAKLDIVLIADGGDSCDADICSTAVALKEKAQGLRIHVVGVSDKPDDVKPLSCLAAATGGTFVIAANASELKQGLATVLDAAAAPAETAPPPSASAEVSAETSAVPPALPMGTATAQPIDLDAQAEAGAEPQSVPGGEALPPGTVSTKLFELEAAQQGEAEPPEEAQPASETEVQKSAMPAAPPVQRVQSVPITLPPPPAAALPEAAAPPPPPAATQPSVVMKPPAAALPKEAAAAPPPAATPPSVVMKPPAAALRPAAPISPPAKTAAAAAPQIQLPVPVTFKALVTEQGPRLQAGLTWRVYAAKALGGSGHKLLSTHREAMPTAALLPGEYLVNAAYGLSNLTKKIKVESGRSLEETFVLNTGGLKLAASLPTGEGLPEGAVSFDILSDEEDQFGNRHTILHNAKQGIVIRLNAGAYRIESLYGDANAIVKADVTVEPGKLTEATIKQTGSKTTFKLVQSLGGEALADTKWTILTSAGDVVKENAGALPTHILAPGSYAVVADHAGLSYTRKFSIEQGASKQVEVVVDDGPTSPEDLKALTDPPEPPPPTSGAGGIMAGDGQTPSPGTGMGFDGFSPSAPADPNAPLLNPGILLRGAR